MKTILESLDLAKTDRRFIDDFDTKVQVLDEKITDLGSTYETELRFANEFRLTVTIGTIFRANRAMYHEARKLAERRISCALFAPVLEKLDEIEGQIYGGERTNALKTIAELRKLLGE